MDISITQEGHKRDFLLFLQNVMVVGGEDKASGAEMENARVELVQKHQASNMMMFGRVGYILLIATAGTWLQVEALPVGGAPRLTTVVPPFKVRTLITAYFVFWQVTHICQQMPCKVKGLSLSFCGCINCIVSVPHIIHQSFA